MPYGISGSGFTRKPIEVIQAEIEEQYKERFGQSIDLNPQSNFGQLVGIQVDRENDLWLLAEDVYSAGTADGATGASLDSVAGLTGTIREEATRSTGFATCVGTNGTVLSSGRGMSVATAETAFRTTEAATIATVSAWVATSDYAEGDLVSNDTGKIYEATTAGTAAGSGGPTGTSTAIADGSVVWSYVATASAAVRVPIESVDTGPKVASAGTLTVIDTPVSGWASVVNALDADLGTDEETDAALRLRREVELRAIGNSAVEAIRAALFLVDDVTAVTVFENIGDATNADGLPPHSIECLVLGGDDAEIAAAIFASKPAGIRPFGQGSGVVTETITDSQGLDHTIYFSRPQNISIWVRVDAVTDADTFPADGAQQIKDAIAAFGDAQKAGKDVVSAALGAQAFGVSGVLDTPIVYIGTSSPATAATTVAISLRQIAVFDTSRITVNVSTGTP